MGSKVGGYWSLTEDEEEELLQNLDTSGTFVTVEFYSGRTYTVGVTAAEWLSDHKYLSEKTTDGEALSTEDMYGSDLSTTEYA